MITVLNTACYLQRWIQTLRETWWILNPAAVPSKIQGIERSLITNGSNGDTNLSDEDLAVMRMQASEKRRIALEESEAIVQGSELKHNKNTEWIRSSDWLHSFGISPYTLLWPIPTL
jgi:hypothetical protein